MPYNQNPRICLLKTCAEKFKGIRAKEKYGTVRSIYEDYFGPITDVYNFKDNQFPEIADLDKYDVFILTGSQTRVSLENKEWIHKLMHIINIIISLDKVIFGFCFGHQLICKTLGAGVGIRSSTRTGSVNVPLNALGKELIGLPNIEMTCFHSDEVKSIKGTHLVRLSKASNDLLVLYNKHDKIQVVTCQGHPELELEFVVNNWNYMKELTSRTTLSKYNYYHDLTDPISIKSRKITSDHIQEFLKKVMVRAI